VPARSLASVVFLSYTSEDAAAAEGIAVALRSAGIQVWFDREELRGGDTWDRQIRRQINDCRLLTAIVSAHTEARDEVYLRRERRLAVEVGDEGRGEGFSRASRHNVMCFPRPTLVENLRRSSFTIQTRPEQSSREQLRVSSTARSTCSRWHRRSCCLHPP